jgi:4-amino-4-deoxy-L-arabinose transferase-like glycosyltransferase
MFFNNYHHIKNKQIYITIFLILFSVLIRIPIISIFGDVRIENEWANIFKNLTTQGNFFFIDGLPSLYMPPLYAYYLYSFSIFSTSEATVTQLVLYSQVVLAGISVAIFYKLNKNFFSEKISFFSSILFSIIPLHLYACSQISSITLQVFLIILFLFLFFRLTKKIDFLSIFFFSTTSGMLILLRGESVVIVAISIIYLFLFFKVKIKKILLISLIALITVSPWLIRNFVIFEKIIIIKTMGYNLWRGNHPLALRNLLVEGSDIDYDNIKQQVTQTPKDIFYRFTVDKIYLDAAIKSIKEEPISFLLLSVKKAFAYLLINPKSNHPNYFHPLHYLPLLFLGISSLAGIGFYKKKSIEFNFLIIILFSYVGIFSILATLPRYKLIILPLQIIFTNVFIEKIKKYYLIKKK